MYNVQDRAINLGELEKRWQGLFPLTQPRVVEKMFQELVAKYSENHRYYHTLDHIDSCLRLLDSVGYLVNDKTAVELAVWFHDAIYNPKKSDNEHKSAQFARKCLVQTEYDDSEESDESGESIVSKIEHLIRLTQHPSKPKANDEKILIDIDLCILGATEGDYDQYAESIRKEYSHVPAWLYRRGRKKVLKSFLNGISIFHTAHFQEKFEKQAITNITKELSTL